MEKNIEDVALDLMQKEYEKKKLEKAIPTVSEIVAQLKKDPEFIRKIKGERGDYPDHQWKGNKLRFMRADGSWGQWVELKAFGGNIIYQGSSPSSSAGGVGGSVACTGAEINTGTNTTKFATPKAIADSDLLSTSDLGTISVSTFPNDSGYVYSTNTSDISLGEYDIKLDATLSGDEKWSGISIAGTAGEQLVAGEVCYLASTGKWLKNDGILDGTDTGFSKQLGICILAASGDTEPTEMLVYGKVRSAKFPALTVGSPAYLSDTAGEIVVAQPSTANFAIRVVGFAITAEDLLFNPSNDYIIHT